ncbi:MAG: hypothetical protein IIB30_08290 [Chloroflexi bacterium]|nr:hypothetical protein [Chloroflexota bacterium]
MAHTIVDGEVSPFEYEEPVRVTFVLTQSDLDLADGDTSRLRVLRYDEETSEWQQIPVVYEADPPPAGQLVAKLSHFSTYAVAVVAEPAAPQFSVPTEVSLVETRAVEPTATPSPTAVAVETSTPVPAAPTAVVVAQARPTPQPTATPRPTATALPPAPAVPAAPAPPSQPPTQPEAPPVVEESGGIGTTTLVILIVVGIAVLAGVGVVGRGLRSRRQQA